MAKYRKIDSRIWNDAKFCALSDGRKMETIKAIAFGRDAGAFSAYVGPRFRVADSPRRRPDLYSAEWRHLRLAIIEEQGTTCRYCGMDCIDDPTVDHVKPACQGCDPMDRSNLVVACRSCNSRKGGREGWA
ncbi:MAG: HNH endonuclease signature motif containing protein [Salinisphaeraceae bacterium]